MNKFNQILEKIQKISEEDFDYLIEMINNEFLEDVKNEDEDVTPALIVKLLKSAIEEDINEEEVSGIEINHRGENKKIFALAEYGWDGGHGISSYLFNLVTLANSDILGGPIANIVTLRNTSYPGIAFHRADDLFLIQIFE